MVVVSIVARVSARVLPQVRFGETPEVVVEECPFLCRSVFQRIHVHLQSSMAALSVRRCRFDAQDPASGGEGGREARRTAGPPGTNKLLQRIADSSHVHPDLISMQETSLQKLTCIFIVINKYIHVYKYIANSKITWFVGSM